MAAAKPRLYVPAMLYVAWSGWLAYVPERTTIRISVRIKDTTWLVSIRTRTYHHPNFSLYHTGAAFIFYVDLAQFAL